MKRHVRQAATQLLSLLLLFLCATVASASRDDDGGVRMKDGLKPAACVACHSSQKDRSKLADPSRPCDASCGRCHTDMTKHHPVGGGVAQKEKIGLPLLSGDRLGCMSCHDVQTARTDTRSWKSQSPFDRLFRRRALYQTYYLRINNSDGKLCKTCH
jgi:hypothetical protein